MRHFDFLDDPDRARLFLRAPESFADSDDIELLSAALGATLYSPATRPALANDIAKRAAQGVVSVVACLEDAIADADLADAERNVVSQLRTFGASSGPRPLVFVRVRAPEQITMIVDRLGDAVSALSGFVLPKFTDELGSCFLDAVAEASAVSGRRLLAMPVLESAEIIHVESRLETLLAIRRLLDKHRERILAVRLGATDLSSIYGLRRSRDLTVYDVRMVADVIADVVNIFGRSPVSGGTPSESGYVVTGPVWEYFVGTERMFKPQLRQTPFVEHDERRLRAKLIAADLDGLIREVALDRANGLTGKTVIHPSHVAAVHSLSVVTHEEYQDAMDVLGTASSGGVASSAYRNKMNESKPHTAWARRTMLRARAFGVAREEVSFVDLLGASLQRD
jgi:citrate lyase beta subunit